MKCKDIKNYLKENVIPKVKENNEFVLIDGITNVKSYNDVITKEDSYKWGFIQDNMIKVMDKDNTDFNNSFIYTVYRNPDNSKHIKCYTTFNR